MNKQLCYLYLDTIILEEIVERLEYICSRTDELEKLISLTSDQKQKQSYVNELEFLLDKAKGYMDLKI